MHPYRDFPHRRPVRIRRHVAPLVRAWAVVTAILASVFAILATSVLFLALEQRSLLEGTELRGFLEECRDARCPPGTRAALRATVVRVSCLCVPRPACE